MASLTGRLLWLDLIRAIAAQMIVLHHLAFYGPIAERLGVEAPGLIGWFGEYARIAVQAFLVISGFLFAQSGLMRMQWSLTVVKSAVQRRYLRLFVPFMVAVICACLASVPAREWVGEPDWVSPWPDAKALLAHRQRRRLGKGGGFALLPSLPTTGARQPVRLRGVPLPDPVRRSRRNRKG